MKDMERFEKPSLAVVALVAWVAVVLQYCIILNNPLLSAMNGIEKTLLFFNYFTTLTNTLVAVSSTASPSLK